MKKAIVIIALVAMIIVPVAAKSVLPSTEKGGFAVGLELGQPTGITFDYKIDSKWDGYITAAFGFGNVSYIDAVVGGQYKVTDFNIDKAKFDVNVGVQAGVNILLPAGSLVMCLFCTWKAGWGYEAFTAEANIGQGIRYGKSKVLRFYLTYILPLIIIAIMVLGLI